MRKKIIICIFFPACAVVLFLSLFISCLRSVGNGNSIGKGEVKGLKFLMDVPLNGGSNRFDYQSLNPENNHLYISHMNSNMVTVFDVKTDKILADIKDIQRPTGILVIPMLEKAYVSASHSDKVVIIDDRNFKKIGYINTGSFPDGIAFDPLNKKIFVSDESGGQVTVIDAITDKTIKNINLGGEAGNTQFDAKTKYIYTAAQTANELVVIDPVNNNITEKIKLTGCKGPHGFYIDDSLNYAFITGEDDGGFIVLDLASQKNIYEGKTGTGPDVLAFDSAARRLYVASESGIISIFSIRKNNIRKISEGFLAKHAHSVSVDCKTHKVYFPLQNINGKPVLRIMQASDY